VRSIYEQKQSVNVLSTFIKKLWVIKFKEVSLGNEIQRRKTKTNKLQNIKMS
jgi:hypothetical protein